MRWLEDVLEILAESPAGSYAAQGPSQTEPTALAGLALAAHGRTEAAVQAADWLAGLQAGEGSVGVAPDHPRPRWPTAWAVLCWRAVAQASGKQNDGSASHSCIDAAVRWMLAHEGKVLDADDDVLGHNTHLVGWPWAEGTHSWVEPTAMSVLALQAAGAADHPRCREGRRLLVDRLLPGGGCNYGNTFVLTQKLRPHLQPSGLALLALAANEEVIDDARIGQTAGFLHRSISAETPTASLSWALLGLAAVGRRPPEADTWLEAAVGRSRARGGGNYPMALAALAALDEPSPFLDRRPLGRME